MTGRTIEGRFTEGHPFAALGGEARAERRAATAAEMLAEMPELDGLASGKKICAVVSRLAAHALLSGSQAAAAARCVEIYLKVHEAEMDRQHLRALEVKVAELEEQLALAKRGR